MAEIENLSALQMTTLETLLKECISQRPELSKGIPDEATQREYILWMIDNFGERYSDVTRAMLPYFTPDNAMTRLAAQLVENPSNRKTLSSIARELTVQDEEGYIASGRDISIGRMLRYLPDQWHSNTYFTLYYCFSGRCSVHFRDEVVELQKGSVLIVAPNIEHACPCYADDSVLVFYMIRSSTFNHVFWNQLRDNNLLSKFFHKALSGESTSSYLHFETGNDGELIHLLTRIYEEHQLGEPYAPQMVNALMRVAFLLILRKYEGTARLPRTEDFYWKHEFSAIFSYIQNHFVDASRDDVAAQFHYSSRQVGRIVQEYTGKSYGLLIRELKMNRACELLQQGGYTPEQIAAMTGYSSLSSFYRAFSDYFGCTPMIWLIRSAASQQACDETPPDVRPV